MSSDAIVILRDDHKEIRKLFRDFRSQGDNAVKTKGKIVDKIIEALTVHTYIENEVMYPEIRKRVPDLEDDILESYEEHHVADVLVVELAALSPDNERFDAKTTAYAAIVHGVIMYRIQTRAIDFGAAVAPENPDDMILHRASIEKMLAGTYWGSVV